jgi:ABC-type lipoprotein release transport system permease subunit
MRLFFIIKLAGLALLRSWRATAVLALMIVSAVMVLVFVSALAVGTNDAMIRNSTGLFSGQIIGTGLNESDIVSLQNEHPARIVVRRHMKVMLGNGKMPEPIEMIGVEPSAEQFATSFAQKTIAGRYLQDDALEIYLSEDVSKRLGVAVGQFVTVMNQQGESIAIVKTSGVFRTGLSRFDQALAFCPMQLLPQKESTLSVALFLSPASAPEALAERLTQRFPGAKFLPWSTFMPDLKQLIDLDNFCMRIVITLVFAIVSVGISCAFLIFSLKNIREHGIMKAMGFHVVDTAGLLLAEIILLTAVAVLFGMVSGYALVEIFSRTGIDISQFTSHNQYFAVSGILFPRLTAWVLLAPPGAAFVFSLAASVWPIGYVVSRSPAEILRSL